MRVGAAASCRCGVAGASRRARQAARRRAPARVSGAPSTAVTASSTAKTTEYDAAELAEWLASYARQNSAVVPGAPSDGSATLLASRAIRKGEAVLSLDAEALLTRDSAESSQRIGAALRATPDTKDWVCLACLLIDERSRGEQSELAPWLAALPPPGALALPMFWSDDELAKLEGTQLLERARGYKEYVEFEHGELAETLFAEHPQVFPANVFTAEALAWAFGTLRERCHPPLNGGGEQLAMAPGADLARFDEASQARWALRGTGPLGLGGSRALELVADRDYAEGEEVCMAFGAEGATCTDLALDHGVYGGSAAEGYTLSLEVPEDDPNYDDKADVAELNGLGEQESFVCRAGGEMGLDPDFLPYMRMVNIAGTDAFHLESLFREEAWEHFKVPLSEESEAAVCEAMLQGCDAALEVTEASRAEDRAVCREGAAGGYGPRRVLAAQLREGERRVLEGLREAFSTRKEELPIMEYYASWRLKSLQLIDEDGNTTYSNYDGSGLW